MGRIETFNTGGSIFIGEGAGKNDDFSSNLNTFVGYETGYANTIGSGNSFFGSQAGYNNAGEKNSFFGSETGLLNTTGSYNTAIGFAAGFSNQTGSNNIFIGYNAGYSEAGNNKLYIHNSDASSPLIYGEFDNNLLQINGTLSINGSYEFPTIDGGGGQVLTTDGNGSVYWSDVNTSINLTDADSDTKIQVEESTDEDIIRFDVGGVEYFRMESGRLQMTNTGNSCLYRRRCRTK